MDFWVTRAPLVLSPLFTVSYNITLNIIMISYIQCGPMSLSRMGYIGAFEISLSLGYATYFA